MGIRQCWKGFKGLNSLEIRVTIYGGLKVRSTAGKTCRGDTFIARQLLMGFFLLLDSEKNC